MTRRKYTPEQIISKLRQGDLFRAVHVGAVAHSIVAIHLQAPPR